MSEPTFYVIEATPTQDETDDIASIPGRGTELQSLGGWFAPKAKEVSTERLLESFEKTQLAIDAMLAKLESGDQRGFRLDEFEVSLAVSGEGTIGIVTASAEAGVVLKFKRAEASAETTS